jgi:5-methylcytosine-specific restriction endonuclease McrA
MPFQRNGVRDYKRELAWEKTKKPSRAKDRLARGRARTAVGLKVGDPREVDHVKPLSKGGDNKRSNLKVVSRKTNATKEAKSKQSKARSK